ncbi:MAG: flagellar motor protein MotB [Rhodospirillaceae bacterium]|nr:flagellar motor protein MotB [Magnetovibrio sp.]MAY66252.1 flagellar motor protein MotB [Rhodospirillaceae bacterium]
MKFLNKLAVLGLTGALVAACSSIDLDATKMMSLSGDNFQKALFKEYVDLARSEDDQADSRSAVYYNNRAKMAAAGKDTGPQELKDRKIPSSAAADLAAARKELTAALAAGAGKSAPEKAARAQAMFDCWMEQQEENDQPKDIAACRSAFETAMKGLGGAKPAEKKAMMEKEFIIYFDFNKANLNEAATAVAYQVMAESISGYKQILLTGHADTAGDKAYNRKLSEMRVNTVKNAFAEIGLDPAKIKTQFNGEDMPAEKTADGVKNQKNRRVTVVLVK